MNKKVKSLYALAFSFLLLSSCSSANEDIPEENIIGEA